MMPRGSPAAFARSIHRRSGATAENLIRTMLAGTRRPADRSFLLRALGELQILRLTDRHPSL